MISKIQGFRSLFFFGKQGSLFFGYGSPAIRFTALRSGAAAVRFIWVLAVVLFKNAGLTGAVFCFCDAKLAGLSFYRSRVYKPRCARPLSGKTASLFFLH